MLRRFLRESSATSAIEYIVVATLAIAILASCVWALMQTVADKGESAATSLESQIPEPP